MTVEQQRDGWQVVSCTVDESLRRLQ